MTFRQFLEHNPSKIYGSLTANPNGPGNTPGTHNDGNRSGTTGKFVSTAWSGSESRTEDPFVVPSIDLIFDKIKPIKDNSPIYSVDGDRPRPKMSPKNIIKITLQNGRQILMNSSEFDRGGGSERIAPGKVLNWILQPKNNFYQVQRID